MQRDISVVGIDIAKRVFHLVGMDKRGKIVMRKRCSRGEVVWSKNSCGFTRVVFQKSPKPFTTLNGTLTRRVWADRRKEQDIALALMIPLVMKMRHILRQRMAE